MGCENPTEGDGRFSEEVADVAVDPCGAGSLTPFHRHVGYCHRRRDQMGWGRLEAGVEVQGIGAGEGIRSYEELALGILD